MWVGFPVLRQCFTEYLGWTQTTNNPSESDLYGLVAKDGGYVLDGEVKPFDTHTETIKVRQADGTTKDEALIVRRTVHGPVVAERRGMPIAMRVVALDRPRLFEQFWRMGLAKNLAEWEDAMRMQQLPLFNTAYADRTATSPTSTTPRCRCTPPATTASGRASCRATARTSSRPTSCPTTRSRR